RQPGRKHAEEQPPAAEQADAARKAEDFDAAQRFGHRALPRRLLAGSRVHRRDATRQSGQSMPAASRRAGVRRREGFRASDEAAPTATDENRPPTKQDFAIGM